jgi:diguanylate cyclase (GGDEF)-like protein
MPGTGTTEATRIAERIRAHFADAARSVDGHAVSPTVSVGVATTSAPTVQVADLMAAADHALYRAKAEGRNRVALVDCDAAGEGAPSIVPDAPVLVLSRNAA